MRRWLEVNTDTGVAFHEPGASSPFSMGEMLPPTEVLFCDCQGVGRVCHHTYADETEVGIHGHLAAEETQKAWRAKHVGPVCKIRRQIFIDVTERPEALLGMRYNEKKGTFTEV